MIEPLFIVAGATLGIGVLLLDRHHRRLEARRRGDVAFMAHALDVAQRRRQVRPKVDARIQRRRYGPG